MAVCLEWKPKSLRSDPANRVGFAAERTGFAFETVFEEAAAYMAVAHHLGRSEDGDVMASHPAFGFDGFGSQMDAMNAVHFPLACVETQTVFERQFSGLGFLAEVPQAFACGPALHSFAARGFERESETLVVWGQRPGPDSAADSSGV